MRKKFEITDQSPPYLPEDGPEPSVQIIQPLSSRWSANTDDDHWLYITLAAMKQIANHIGWGKDTRSNKTEQGGILLGRAYTCSSKNLTYGVVHAAVPGKSARGSSSHLEMTHQTWKEMLDVVASLTSSTGEPQLQVIGWYHTHPRSLDVFMSGVDLETQHRLFVADWQFAVVLNPQRRIWRAYNGPYALECKGAVINGTSTQPDELPQTESESFDSELEGLIQETDAESLSDPTELPTALPTDNPDDRQEANSDAHTAELHSTGPNCDEETRDSPALLKG